MPARPSSASNCGRGPRTMLPLLASHPRRGRHACRGAPGAIPHTRRRGLVPVARRWARLPGRAGPAHVRPLRGGRIHSRRPRARRRVPRPVLRRGAPPRPRDGRGDGSHAAREPLLARHVQARRISARTRACSARTSLTPSASEGSRLPARSAGRGELKAASRGKRPLVVQDLEHRRGGRGAEGQGPRGRLDVAPRPADPQRANYDRRVRWAQGEVREQRDTQPAPTSCWIAV